MKEIVITILTSASVSAGLTAALFWLTKSWIGERIKGSIKNEYDLKLESHKAQLKAEHELNIERLKMGLGDVSAERNARRDYEYEARKKLYSEYEPLLFQLIEQSENAYYRVLSLARTAREGDLTVVGGGWLDHPGYYMRSTIYKLLAPIALFKIIQRNLTFVDLSVDPGIAANYMLAKALYLTFTCDFELAEENPAIKYEPHANTAEKLRAKNPQQFWRQGIPLGCLDNVIHDCLISEDQPARLRTFGDFERIVKKLTEGEEWHDIKLFYNVFENFHPLTRPVLWRVLVAQAHINQLLIGRIGAGSMSPQKDMLSKLSLPTEELSKFQWHEDEAYDEAIKAAESFLEKYINEFKIVA